MFTNSSPSKFFQTTKGNDDPDAISAEPISSMIITVVWNMIRGVVGITKFNFLWALPFLGLYSSTGFLKFPGAAAVGIQS
jgi:hypothetical protein